MRWWCLLCMWPTYLVGFLVIANWKSRRIYIQSTNLCHYSLKLHAQQRSSQYQLESLLWSNLGLITESTILKANMLTITTPMQLRCPRVSTIDWCGLVWFILLTFQTLFWPSWVTISTVKFRVFFFFCILVKNSPSQSCFCTIKITRITVQDFSNIIPVIFSSNCHWRDEFLI